MQLIDDFKRKYPKYWSVWLHFAAGLLSALEILDRLGLVLPLLDGMVPPGTFVALSLLFTVAGLIARALKQSGLVDEAPQEPSA